MVMSLETLVREIELEDIIATMGLDENEESAFCAEFSVRKNSEALLEKRDFHEWQLEEIFLRR